MTVRPFLFTMCDVSFLLYGKSLLTTVNLFLSFISDIICCECSAPNRPLCPRWKMSKSILYSINRTGMFYFVSPEPFNDYNFAKCSQFSETQTISIILWHTFLKSDLQKHWTWKNDSREKRLILDRKGCHFWFNCLISSHTKSGNYESRIFFIKVKLSVISIEFDHYWCVVSRPKLLLSAVNWFHICVCSLLRLSLIDYSIQDFGESKSIIIVIIFRLLSTDCCGRCYCCPDATQKARSQTDSCSNVLA